MTDEHPFYRTAPAAGGSAGAPGWTPARSLAAGDEVLGDFGVLTVIANAGEAHRQGVKVYNLAGPSRPTRISSSPNTPRTGRTRFGCIMLHAAATIPRILLAGSKRYPQDSRTASTVWRQGKGFLALDVLQTEGRSRFEEVRAMITLNDAAPHVTAAEIDSVERRLGFTFPAAIRALYLQFNGGLPVPNRYVDNAGPCIVHEFLSVIHGPAELTMEKTWERARSFKALPESLVPFAVDPGGNFYCFRRGVAEDSPIYLFRVDGMDEPVEEICESAETFLSRLS